MTCERSKLVDGLRASILHRVNTFQAVTGMSDTRLSREVANEQGLVARLRAGENVTLNSIARLERWLDKAETDAARRRCGA